ncbi:MAG: 1-deoxy-D-xylulose-5-phosphate synthase N-terminal domain-containing protein [Azospirillaceae bacterium]
MLEQDDPLAAEGGALPPGPLDSAELAELAAIEDKVRWLATWTIHHANHVRPNRDGIKVGGHQASSASVVAIMTALYFRVLRPQDRVAVKPHASPVLHAIEYLFGRQSLDRLKAFRGFGGAQSYPSRTKDGDFVDFSTGSVGLGAAVTNFAALTQDYLQMKGLAADRPRGRMVALVGDAELDEGNVYEALLDTWKHDIRNVWWVIDYNRQSLDGMVNEELFRLIGRFFRAVGWNVVTVKYGRRQVETFARPGGQGLKHWINACPNDLYSALAFEGGAAWRRQIAADRPQDATLHALLDSLDDAALHAVMTNLGGHCLEALAHAFEGVTDDRPTCFICYTIKGHGLPLAGHKDNHAGLMNPQQMAAFRQAKGIAEGAEWDRHAGLAIDPGRFDAAIARAPFYDGRLRRASATPVAVPDTLPAVAFAGKGSTQEAFGRILNEIGKSDLALADRIVTTSPDVTVSTNLGGWVNQRGLFGRSARDDLFRARKVPSAQKWQRAPTGQHVELGIAENNLFLNLAALGLAHDLFGERLIPIGTLYDPFIARGLDALNYACYQDARFIVVATPSGISLAPEGGAHQSIATPMIGMGQPGLTSFEPAFADEVAAILHWGFGHLQAPDGGAIYLRLSTRPITQVERRMDPDLAGQVINGGYWLVPPEPGADMAIVAAGAMLPEAMAAFDRLLDDHPGAGLLVVTSTDRLYNDWQHLERARLDDGPGDMEDVRDRSRMAHVEDLLEPLAGGARMVTVLDGHPAALAWLGAVRGHAVAPLGVNTFGQSGDSIDLYRSYQIDEAAILAAARRFGRPGD